MTPTAKLRWLQVPVTERVAQRHPSAIPLPNGTVRVLQQWWEGDVLGIKIDGEWRDIEIAREE